MIKKIVFSFLPFILLSCDPCRNDDAAPSSKFSDFKIVYKDVQDDSFIIQNPGGEGIYPADQIKFLDANQEETNVFRITDEGIVIYNIPDYVSKAQPRFSYYIEFEPNKLFEFELIQQYYSDDCNTDVMNTVQMNVQDEIFILYPDQIVEVHISI